MHPTPSTAGQANHSLARILAHAVEAADKPKHQIAREVGMHRETLLRVMRGERPIGLDEAASILVVCGAFPRASMILALAGQEDLACERSEEHTSELQSLMRISYAVFCLKKKKKKYTS